MSKETRLPNLVCPGVMKAGTTTLYDILKQHPDIFECEQKEPHFFDRNFEDGLENYKALYKNAGNEKYLPDFSPSYLFSDKSVYRIKECLGDDVKFIVMLRNPGDRAYSHFGMMISNAFEIHGSFEKAIELENERAKERNINFWRFSYVKRGFYAQQVKRLMECYDTKNLHFVIFERFIKETETEVRKIFRFLGIDNEVDMNYNVWSGKFTKYKHPYYRKFIYKIFNSGLSPLAQFIKRLMKEGTADRFRSLLKKRGSIAPKTKKNLITCRKLMNIYKDDILELEELIGEDLSAWIEKYS